MRFRHSLLLIILLSTASIDSAPAQNPIVPPGRYMADPSARVFGDGKLYLYVSVDESPDYYCSWTHHVLSTEDLRTWTLHENRFASKGPEDQVQGSDALLFAPDCHVRDGTYYLYFCMPDRNFTEGVARSSSPLGPFEGGRRIDLHGHDQIDPAVFIDDDGQGYYIWGQFTVKMARLNPDMSTLDEASIRDRVLTEKEHFFHEGACLTKREGRYYMVYAHMGRAEQPTCLGYAVADKPMGPYRYGGVIIDNDHCDPETWNNHGCISEFDGRWYVFYHRSTHGCRTMRKACVEPIRFNPDGSIDEVEMTSQGAGPPLNACESIDAERACLLFGGVRIRRCGERNEELAGIRPGDRVAFKYVDFGKGVDSVTLWVRGGEGKGRIDLALDRPWNGAFARIEVEGAPGTDAWRTITAPVAPVRGVHALWVRFRGEGPRLPSLDRFRFTAAGDPDGGE